MERLKDIALILAIVAVIPAYHYLDSLGALLW